MPPSDPSSNPASDRPASEAAAPDAEASADPTRAEPSLADTQAGPRSATPSQRGSSDAPGASYLAGDIIAGKYQLSSVLGTGGMGAVWLAKNLALDIDVAVKLIRRDFATAEASQRLLQEARAAARIGHPSIVRVFDFGTTEQKDPFIVMEVLHGESLAETIARKRRLTTAAAVRTLLPVASALAAAHGKGIVHRDLKPDNVLLVTDDRGVVVPKVVDFGIAKLHHEEAVRTTTQAGVILGSPHYMSPEQACGRSDVDHRTDVWAFCVMLYEAVTGVKPFDGGNYNALMSSILLRDPPPWSELGVDDELLWSIVQKGLEKEPDDRFPSMRVLGAALAEWAQDVGVETDAAGNSLKAHWLESEDHRPLSDTPPASMTQPGGPRPRMMSERELRPPNLPSGLGFDGDAAEEPTEEPPDAADVPESMEDASPRPPGRVRSHALWIGPLALAVGALGTGAWVLLTRGPVAAPPPDERTPAATSATSSAAEGETKPANIPAAPPSASAPEALAPASSASADEMPSVAPSNSSTQTPLAPKPAGKKGPNGAMPLPENPGF